MQASLAHQSVRVESPSTVGRAVESSIRLAWSGVKWSAVEWVGSWPSHKKGHVRSFVPGMYRGFITHANHTGEGVQKPGLIYRVQQSNYIHTPYTVIPTHMHPRRPDPQYYLPASHLLHIHTYDRTCVVRRFNIFRVLPSLFVQSPYCPP